MEKDVVQIRCLSDNERYADLINGVVFGGRQVVHGEDIREMDSQTGLWRAFPGKKTVKTGKKFRDLIRKVAMGVNFTVIGVENQDKVHYLMPLRAMLYDAAEYERQASRFRKRVKADRNITDAEFLSGFKKTDRLHPCVTLVLFYGKEWDGSRDLHGILDFTDIPQELRGFINQYPMHLLEVRKLQNTEIFCSDLKQIFDFIRMSEDKKGLKRLVQGDAAYQNMDEDAYDMAVAYTNAAELIAVKEFHRKDGKVNMCKALTELIEEGREEGREEGIIGMIRDNLDRGTAREEIAEKLCKYFGMSSDRAWEYLNEICPAKLSDR